MTHLDEMRLGQVGALPAAALALALAYWMLRTLVRPLCRFDLCRLAVTHVKFVPQLREREMLID